jgi:hypothetical protein
MAMAASKTLGKVFIKQSLGELARDLRAKDLRFRLVPLPGEDVAKSGRHRGEMFAAGALVNERDERDAQIVSAMHRVCDVNLRHADAHDSRANDSMKV